MCLVGERMGRDMRYLMLYLDVAIVVVFLVFYLRSRR